eukprot:TRINITY_DN13713_c0_g1_i4.p1 TRINITY_DN13713_c0_g1~~TRINITY_DN13713_c0_g1_i4.p1  ORF type:complete len:210 (+),score=45.37 TRINITY_DN13713_c0_g1_i4:58-687(+)
MLKLVVAYGVILSLSLTCTLAAANRQDSFVNNDLPFGFWFGGHGQVRRQARAEPAPRATRPGGETTSISERDLELGERIFQILLEKMHQRRKSILRERQMFGLLGMNRMAQPSLAVRSSAASGRQSVPSGGRALKRSPEIAQNLQQYNPVRGLYGLEVEGQQGEEAGVDTWQSQPTMKPQRFGIELEEESPMSDQQEPVNTKNIFRLRH